MYNASPTFTSEGLEPFLVLAYDPLFQTCDLQPIGVRQQGTAAKVPIAVGRHGSWEKQQQWASVISTQVSIDQWGNAPRGPRWGETFPIQPGDVALVGYVDGLASERVIVGFQRGQGDYGPPWVANQVLSSANDYTRETPEADDLTDDRYDLLLPSGAWLRGLNDGSWVIASAPVDRAKVFLSMNANGSFKLKARNDEQYACHVEFDAAAGYGRICVGSSESGSAIEFKDGDIIIRPQKNLRIFAQRVDGDVRPQKSSALDSLVEAGISAGLASLGGPVAQYAGEQILSGAFNPIKKSGAIILDAKKRKSLFGELLNAPGLDAAVRGKISELLVNPQALLNETIAGLGNAVETSAIGQQLTGLLGAGALNGLVSDIQSQLDLTKIADKLGIPSWITQTIEGQIPNLQALDQIIDEIINLPDHLLLDQVLQRIGAAAMGGDLASTALAIVNQQIADLPSGLRNRIRVLLDEELDTTPLLPPGEDLDLAAQRVGLLIAQGETLLGGNANLFGAVLPLLQDLPNFQNIGNVAAAIESYFTNPHDLLEDVPGLLAVAVEQIDAIPPEIRQVMRSLPQGSISRLPELLGIVPVPEAHEHDPNSPLFHESFLSPIGREFDAFSALLDLAPPEVKQLLQSIPPQIFQAIEELPAILEDPIRAITADNQLLNTVFGGIGLGKAKPGLFDVRVSKIAKFDRVPKMPKTMEGVAIVDEFHLSTESAPITRVDEFGALELPNWFSVD